MGFVLIVLISSLLFSCSTVFTASISGSAIDKESWEEDEQEVGIGDVEVFLYNEEKEWTEDYTKWTEEGIRPDTVEEGEDPHFFLSTVTGADGAFTFSGLIWNRLFPSYGKSGDRVEVFFIFYNRDYGVSKNTTPVFIVSDVTNQRTPFKLERITNPAVIEGTIKNQNTAEGVGAVNVNVFVATSIDPITYPDNPDYQTTTDAEGEYTQNISFAKGLGDYGRAKITVNRNEYNCENYDGDGTPANDYLQTGLIEKETTYTVADIEIKQTKFTNETLEGRVADDLATEATYVNGALIKLYVDRSSPPAAGDEPDYRTYSEERIYGTETPTIKNGYYSFTGIEWTDEDYTGTASAVTCYIDVDVDLDGVDELDNETVTLYSNANNYKDLEY